jgi:glucose-1-phosphate thymidylyltransferase
MKGIILAGGRACRLYPATKVVCKQLLPVYDKPMVYYPLSVLMLMGIRDILLIADSTNKLLFEDLLGDGNALGLKFSYAVQEKPRGIAESFLIAESFIGKETVCLTLGDNIFFGHRLVDIFREALEAQGGATIFGYYAKNPSRYGVIEFDKENNALSVEEKPSHPKSNWVATGLYLYDNNVIDIAKKLTPSSRGELEVTSVNNEYIKMGKLKVKFLGRGCAWFDMGTKESLIEASNFVRTIEERQGLKIGCVEEVAYRMGYIDAVQLKKLAQSIGGDYSDYLYRVLEGG